MQIIQTHSIPNSQIAKIDSEAIPDYLLDY
jgi:hypothetical protein